MSGRMFEEQVVVVTGAAGQIGVACAGRLGAEGAKVACLDLADPAEVVAGIGNSGGTAWGVAVDLRAEDAVEAAIADILAWAGRIDVLINLAGIYYGVPRAPFWDIDGQTWDLVVQSNLRTAFLCSKAVVEPMRRAGRGRIVHTSSNVAVFGMANFLHYGSAKAGIVGMTRGMARELGPFGIAVNAVAPGLVHTDRTRRELTEEYLGQVVSGQCLKSPILADDVVDAVMFLASGASRMITGATLLVNGGASMGAF